MAMWFCVSALSVSEHDPPLPSAEQIWEEHIFLVEANNAAEAKTKAEEPARRLECTYDAANGSKVNWKFKMILKVYQLEGQPKDGAEVFSRFLRESEVRSLEITIE